MFFSIDRFKSTVDSPCLIEMPETMRQLHREYWYKLSNSAESLSLVFWLTYSVDSRTTTLFLRVSTLFSSKVFFLGVLPQASSTLKLRCWISISFQSFGIQIVWQRISQLFYPHCFIFCYINLYVIRFIICFDVWLDTNGN